MLKEKPSVKSKVEAILFSIGHIISLDEISKLSRSKREDVLSELKELQKEYDEKQSSLMLIEEGDFWKFTVRDHFIPIVRKIVTETELTKSMLETLAVIAFKYPILQSDLIKIRTNKAYEHLVDLEKSGYISRQKHGRTNLIKLTNKFFKYFELTEERLKDKFKDFESISKAIKEKEEEVEKIKEEQRKIAEELGKEDERIKKEIESLDEAEEEYEVPLETYSAKPKEIISEEFQNEGSLIIEKEKVGELEVIEEQKEVPQEEKLMKEKIPIQEDVQERKTERINEQTESQEHKKQKIKERKRKDKGIKVTPEMIPKIEKRVEEITHGEEENKE